MFFNKERGGFEVVSDAKQSLKSKLRTLIRSQQKPNPIYKAAVAVATAKQTAHHSRGLHTVAHTLTVRHQSTEVIVCPRFARLPHVAGGGGRNTNSDMAFNNSENMPRAVVVTRANTTCLCACPYWVFAACCLCTPTYANHMGRPFDVTTYNPLTRLGYRDYSAVREVFSLTRPDD